MDNTISCDLVDVTAPALGDTATPAVVSVDDCPGMKVEVVVRNLVEELGPTISTDSEVMTVT